MDKLREEINQHTTIGCKISDFKILSELGRGSYGIVYKVISRRIGVRLGK